MLLNCESQFSTYHVITNKATAVSCTTITRPPQSSAGVGESPEMLKNLMPTWIICLHFLGVWNWWKRSYVSHTIVGWLVTAAVNEHRAQLRCAYNQTMWFRGCQPSDLSPSAASSASHCSPGKKSCWCGRSRRPRSRSGGPFGALSSGRPPSCCRSATHKGRWEPRRGWGWGPATSLMPGQEPLGTGATVLRSNVCAQATWKMFWVFFFFATGFNHSFIFWGSAWVCSLNHGQRYGCCLTIRLKIQFTLHSALPCCLPLSLTSSAFKLSRGCSNCLGPLLTTALCHEWQSKQVWLQLCWAPSFL